MLMTDTAWPRWGIREHVSSETAEDYRWHLPDLRPIPDQCSPRRLIVFHWAFDAELVVHRLAWTVLQLSCIR